LRIQFKEIFEEFDGFFVATLENGYVAKPSPIVYKKFEEQFNRKKQKIIFVDDKQKNLAAAEKASLNFIGYLFTSGNTLIDDFSKFGIP
jgi:HAD superfamily hydrolase (TIGR01509 family)